MSKKHWPSLMIYFMVLNKPVVILSFDLSGRHLSLLCKDQINISQIGIHEFIAKIDGLAVFDGVCLLKIQVCKINKLILKQIIHIRNVISADVL